jgi:nitric oxide reductase FlRd-NAD(+) reductase
MSKVLVIGGGIGGASAIVGLRKLDKKAEITLLEPKEYCEAAWAAYRSPFDKKVADDSMYPLEPFCEKQNVTHVRSVCKSLSLDKAVMEDGTEHFFDVCVVATGASTKWPALGRGPAATVDGGGGSKEARIQAAQKEGRKLLDAKSVLVVGGGLIGTELAGDILSYAKQEAKEVKVTLVHSGPHLCPEMSESAAAMVQKKLEKEGAKVILNERAVEKDGIWTLAGSGETIDASEVVMTVGLVPINEFMTGLGDEALNESGFIDTDDYFRVKGCGGKIFSIGDCCTTLPNSGSQLLENISTIGHNVKVTLDAIAADKPLDKVENLKKFTLGPKVYIATIGNKDGVMDSPMFHTQRFFPWLKNSTMFFFNVKSKLGFTNK